MNTPRIARISLTAADVGALARFYQQALGFEQISAEKRGGPGFAALMGVSETTRAEVIALRLGQQEVELVGFTPAGAPIPAAAAGNDLTFQHFAIVVSDMRAAFARLQAQPGWRAISRSGPQQLPRRSGGVTAFKFRDPEGHPLELLAFPPDRTPSCWRDAAGAIHLGIDHSAIVVTDTRASVAFYTLGLGFSVGNRSLNEGPEQSMLDHLPSPRVEVSALLPAGAAAPHLELLCYREPRAGVPPASPKHSNDTVATRLVLHVQAPAATARALVGLGGHIVTQSEALGSVLLIRDPDGHDLLLVDA